MQNLQVQLGKTKNQNLHLDGVYISKTTNASITDVANSGNAVLMQKAGFDSTLANRLVSSGTTVTNAAGYLSIRLEKTVSKPTRWQTLRA